MYVECGGILLGNMEIISLPHPYFFNYLPSMTICLLLEESGGAGVNKVTGGCRTSKEGNSMDLSCMRSSAGPMNLLYHC